MSETRRIGGGPRASTPNGSPGMLSSPPIRDVYFGNTSVNGQSVWSTRSKWSSSIARPFSELNV
jgi:hypothetical protein